MMATAVLGAIDNVLTFLYHRLMRVLTLENRYDIPSFDGRIM